MATVTLEQAIALAMQHHQSGRMAEAEAIYRQILAQQPNQSDALHLLGVLAHQTGRNDLALDLIGRAIASNPQVAEYHGNLAAVQISLGHAQAAVEACRRAIALKPDYAQAYYNLGNALRSAEGGGGEGGRADAIAALQRAVELQPDFIAARINLGNILHEAGRPEEALMAYRAAVAVDPRHAEAHNNMGSVLNELGRTDEAISAFRQALVLNPHYFEALCNLASAFQRTDQLEDAATTYRQVLALKPDFLGAHIQFGNVLVKLGRPMEAVSAFRHALALQPDSAELHSNLANALSVVGQLDESLAAHQIAVSLKPDSAELYNNLARSLLDVGRLDDALQAFRNAMRLRPDNPAPHSALILTSLYHPNSTPASLRQECRDWDEHHAPPLQRFIQPHENPRDPDRRLRVGYVSPDFHTHVVGHNILPLFREHDHGPFEIFCYSSLRRGDSLTQQFQSYADHWRSVADLADEQLAAQVRADRIDILVDLTLHSAGNRLPLFARKPAPLQVSFAGYPGGTGLSAIDYHITDPYLEPLEPSADPRRGNDAAEHPADQPLRLPDSFWCYDPAAMRAEGDPQPNALPASTGGRVTFGCLNNFCKVNEAVLRLWARVLVAAPGSRFLLLTVQGSHRQRVAQVLAESGVDPARIEFIAPMSPSDYLKTYHRIDLALDTFPYNGHTTSLDAFWMGVPVVTLVGQTVVGRAGWSQLNNLGLPELAAHDPDQFVSIAVALAGDVPRLAELRRTLRPRMLASPLTDAKRFARNIESLYRQIWQRWRA